MRLSIDQLEQHFKTHCAAVFIVSGDTTLLVEEAADTIRQGVRTQGFEIREQLSMEPNFDWGQLTVAAQSLSLFGERKLIEIRLKTGKPGAEGAKALIEYCQAPPTDTVLLIILPKIDRGTQKAKWFQTLDSTGVITQVWPIDHHKLPAWIHNRMQRHNLRPTKDAVQLLADRVEGNLLAAAQEITKLTMLYSDQVIDIEMVRDAVSDHARYDVFGLIDCALQGNKVHTIKILNTLRANGTEPLAILWAIARELRALLQLQTKIKTGIPLSKAMSELRIWDSRKHLMQRTLNQASSKKLQYLLVKASTADLQAKGGEVGDPWNTLTSILLKLSH